LRRFLMIIYDLNQSSISAIPMKNNAPLVIDADAVELL